MSDLIEVYQIRRQDENGYGQWLNSSSNRSGYYKTLVGVRIARGLFKGSWSYADRNKNMSYDIYQVIPYADADGDLHLGRERVNV